MLHLLLLVLLLLQLLLLVPEVPDEPMQAGPLTDEYLVGGVGRQGEQQVRRSDPQVDAVLVPVVRQRRRQRLWKQQVASSSNNSSSNSSSITVIRRWWRRGRRGGLRALMLLAAAAACVVLSGDNELDQQRHETELPHAQQRLHRVDLPPVRILVASGITTTRPRPHRQAQQHEQDVVYDSRLGAAAAAAVAHLHVREHDLNQHALDAVPRAEPRSQRLAEGQASLGLGGGAMLVKAVTGGLWWRRGGLESRPLV